MPSLTSTTGQVLIALTGALLMLAVALAAPSQLILVMPALVAGLGALALYQFPRAMVAIMILTYGCAIDVQVDLGMLSGSSTGALGMALVKLVPFALTAALVLRYGPQRAVNWPFLAFTAIAGLSVAILPIGRIVTQGEMLRSFIGSTAPFVLGFALAPRSLWTAFIRGAALVPLISAGLGLLTWVAGLYPAFDAIMRFQGLHTPPFLAGYCVVAIFAATLEYLRGGKLAWLIIGAANLGVLLATQARTPFAAALLFLLVVFLASGRRILPLGRKVDLVMGGMVPGLILLGPLLLHASGRFFGEGEFNFSGRDIIWPYFLDAIEARPLFGFGLGAGKLIVDPEDPRIRLLGSSAAHNEFLRLSVDAGVVGCAAVFLAIIAWIWSGSRIAAPADRLVLRAGLLATLLFTGFDNTLIAGMGVMIFSVFAAILARARIEAAARPAAATHGRREAAARHRRVAA